MIKIEQDLNASINIILIFTIFIGLPLTIEMGFLTLSLLTLISSVVSHNMFLPYESNQDPSIVTNGLYDGISRHELTSENQVLLANTDCSYCVANKMVWNGQNISAGA